MKKNILAKILLIFTVVVWGTTFIVTKKLLVYFNPVEILVYRFSISYIVLFLLKPKILKWQGLKQEGLFLIAGLSGIAIYQYMENYSLQFTTASNVSIIIACASFFTAIFSRIILKSERISHFFIIGFIISIIGVSLVSLNGLSIEFNPKGDLIALFASILWGIYSVVVSVLTSKKEGVIVVTRRITLYGCIALIPLCLITKTNFNLESYKEISNIFYIVFLGVIASAICFCTWNYAVEKLGSIKTSLGVYAIPIVTTIVAIFALNEKLTILSALGIVITLFGLYLSSFKKKENKSEEKV